MIRAGNQILGAGGLADEHSALVVLLEDRIELVNLLVYGIGGDHIGRGNQHHLIASALEQGYRRIRQDALRDAGPQQTIQT